MFETIESSEERSRDTETAGEQLRPTVAKLAGQFDDDIAPSENPTKKIGPLLSVLNCRTTVRRSLVSPP